jgi:hypothetical protein
VGRGFSRDVGLLAQTDVMDNNIFALWKQGGFFQEADLLMPHAS